MDNYNNLSKEELIALLTKQNKELSIKDEPIANQSKQISSKEKQIANQTKLIDEKDKLIVAKQAKIEKLEVEIETLTSK